MSEQETERDASAPEQPQGESSEPGAVEYVHLPQLVASEFGISMSQARMEIAMGTVEIDGEQSAEKMDLPASDVIGKEITVIGNTRHFKFTYAPGQNDFAR